MKSAIREYLGLRGGNTMGKPEKIRRLLGAVLALGLAAAVSGGVLAVPPPSSISLQPGKTAVGVQTVDMDPENLSFTVPLYLTVAAASDSRGNSSVITPKGYLMRNTTGSTPDGQYPGIVVTKLDVQGVRGGTWSLSASPGSGKEIRLSVGGLVLPDVNAGDKTPVSVETKDSSNSFFDSGSGGYLPIPGGPGADALVLPVEGSLPPGFVPGEEQAAAQFRIKYTVSLLDSQGKPVGISYEGPAREDAVQPSQPSSSEGS